MQEQNQFWLKVCDTSLSPLAHSVTREDVSTPILHDPPSHQQRVPSQIASIDDNLDFHDFDEKSRGHFFYLGEEEDDFYGLPNLHLKFLGESSQLVVTDVPETTTCDDLSDSEEKDVGLPMLDDDEYFDCLTSSVNFEAANGVWSDVPIDNFHRSESFNSTILSELTTSVAGPEETNDSLHLLDYMEQTSSDCPVNNDSQKINVSENGSDLTRYSTFNSNPGDYHGLSSHSIDEMCGFDHENFDALQSVINSRKRTSEGRVDNIPSKIPRTNLHLGTGQLPVNNQLPSVQYPNTAPVVLPTNYLSQLSNHTSMIDSVTHTTTNPSGPQAYFLSTANKDEYTSSPWSYTDPLQYLPPQDVFNTPFSGAYNNNRKRHRSLDDVCNYTFNINNTCSGYTTNVSSSYRGQLGDPSSYRGQLGDPSNDRPTRTDVFTPQLVANSRVPHTVGTSNFPSSILSSFLSPTSPKAAATSQRDDPRPFTAGSPRATVYKREVSFLQDHSTTADAASLPPHLCKDIHAQTIDFTEVSLQNQTHFGRPTLMGFGSVMKDYSLQAIPDSITGGIKSPVNLFNENDSKLDAIPIECGQASGNAIAFSDISGSSNSSGNSNTATNTTSPPDINSKKTDAVACPSDTAVNDSKPDPASLGQTLDQDTAVDGCHKDPDLEKAYKEYLRTGKQTHLIKEELRRKIMYKRCVQGKAELPSEPGPNPSTSSYELSEEEAEKKRRRQDLNRIAASNLRGRRKATKKEWDMSLQHEEDRKRHLEAEIERLQKEKAIRFLLLSNRGILNIDLNQ